MDDSSIHAALQALTPFPKEKKGQNYGENIYDKLKAKMMPT